MREEREFPAWETFYAEQSVEKMPWYYTGMDPDLEQGLRRWTLQSGDALDIGTGPGTQAIALAERGFRVTGVDISEAAVQKATARARTLDIEVQFQRADILTASFDINFDLVFDRGCFHVQPPDRREDYVRCLHRHVAPSGFLFLKCFSREEPDGRGPYRFTPDEIESLFSPFFTVQSIDQTVYHGQREPMPRALFSVLHRK